MEWPNRFIYLCSATASTIVNAKPLVDAGPGRVARIIQFVGAPSRTTDEVRDQREALQPSRRFSSWVRDYFGERSPPIEERNGDAEVIMDWRDHMIDACSKANGLPVIANLAGGTTSMKLGIVLGRHTTGQFLLVQGSPLRTEFIQDLEQVVAKQHSVLDLRSYLTLYGMRENGDDRQRRRSAQDLYLAKREIIEDFGTALFDAGGQLALSFRLGTEALFQKDRDNRERFVPGTFDLAVRGADPKMSGLLDRLRGYPGLEHRRDGTRFVTNSDTAFFLRGKWLEAFLYLKLTNAFSDWDAIEVATGVHLQYADSEGGKRPEVGELDIAIMIGGQLHAIEAKSGSLAPKYAVSNEESLAKVEVLKRNLLGQIGQFVVCAPSTSEVELAKSGDFVEKCRRAGIVLRVGSTAARDTVDFFKHQQ